MQNFSDVNSAVFSIHDLDPGRTAMWSFGHSKLGDRWIPVALPPPRVSHCYTMTFSLRGRLCKPSVRFEEFRLRNSLLRAQCVSFADHSRKLRANSPFGISLVRLRDVIVIVAISHRTRIVDQVSGASAFSCRLHNCAVLYRAEYDPFPDMPTSPIDQSRRSQPTFLRIAHARSPHKTGFELRSSTLA
jgi:hypothetical protein